MKIIIEWTEGREIRRTEIEVPTDKTWTELQEYVISGLRKAIKYSNVPMPKGITEGEL